MERNIVFIDEGKCNGCGMCIPNCTEGAINIIDGKAKLVDEKFCDGLGACLGHCPQNAIKIIEREAPAFDAEAVKMHVISKLMQHACLSSHAEDFRNDRDERTAIGIPHRRDSELRQWPVQLTLVSPQAPYLRDAEMLVSADCVPFAYANFHSDFLRGRSLVIGCPKLDDAEYYIDKLAEMLKKNNIKSIKIVNMEVPCCFGLQHIVEKAVKRSGKAMQVRQTVISIKGEKLDTKHLS